MAASTPFSTDKLIRFHHCDPAGIVFYPQYFVLINELTEDWFAQGLGIDFARLHGEMRRGVPVRRLGQPIDIAQTAAFLLSDEAGYINATTIVLDGGTMALPPW